MMAAWLAAAQLFALSPVDKAAAVAAGEEAKLAQYAREDAIRYAPRPARGMFGLGIGASSLTPQGYAPIGDVGQQDFVFRPESLGSRRYRN